MSLILVLVFCFSFRASVSEAEEKTLSFSWITSLKDLTKASPTAESLFAFYDSLGSLFAYDGNLSLSLKQPKIGGFYTVILPKDEDLPPGAIGVAVDFNSEDSTLSLYSYDFSSVVQGLLLAGALSHALDYFSGLEPPNTELLSPIWLEGERRSAFRLNQILNDLTGGKWSEIVEESRLEREKIANSLGKRPTTYTFGPAPGDSTRIVNLFQINSPEDLAVLQTFLTVQANIRTIQARVFTYRFNDELPRHPLPWISLEKQEEANKKVDNYFRAFYQAYTNE